MSTPYIIAEIASSHEGRPELAARLFNLAAGTGADAVKFQIFQRDSLLSSFHPKFASFGEIEMSAEAWEELLREAGRSQVDVIVEVFDEASLEIAERSGVVKAYKLPTSDIGNHPFLARVAASGKPVLPAVGGALMDEITAAVGVLRSAGAARIVLMHGFQSYPTRIEDTNLERLRVLARTFGLEIGYADHVDAEDRELARALPLMAMAAGCTVIEKHITDARSRKGRDRFSALNPDEFADFVALMRRVAPAMGSAADILTPAEETYRREMKRQAVAARPLAAGTRLSMADVAFKRTFRSGLSHADTALLIGRVLTTAKQADEPIDAEDFQ